MARRAADLPYPPSVVLANPDEDCSPAAFRELLVELAAGPEPTIESVDAAEALAEIRAERDEG